MDFISERLIKNRPELSSSTLKTYNSILKSLGKRVFGDDVKLKDFENYNKIMEDLKDKPISSRKTALSALFVLTGLNKYNELMRQGIEEYQSDVNKQEMNDKQKEAFRTQDEIKEIIDNYKDIAEFLFKKNNRNVKDIQDIQDYIILCLTSGYYIPPRRAEWCKFKIKNIGDNDNYIKNNKEFIFKTFKGSEKKGTQSIEIPKPLQKILKKWLMINPTDYLLHDVKGEPLNAVKLNQRLTKLFGKGFSINGLRHSYLSSKYQDTIKLNDELADDMAAMGSSKAQEKVYIKKIN
jgi:hypothetical protein